MISDMSRLREFQDYKVDLINVEGDQCQAKGVLVGGYQREKVSPTDRVKIMDAKYFISL